MLKGYLSMFIGISPMAVAGLLRAYAPELYWILFIYIVMAFFAMAWLSEDLE